MTRVVILYYSRNGATQQLADAIAEGVTAAGGEAVLCSTGHGSDAVSDRDLEVENADLETCDALILGSPTRFGHMASSLQKFWEGTSREWLQATLTDKPGAVFTSSSSLHGGQESTLLTLALPLLHHGMMLVGIPYSEPALHQTQSGGSPYGASHHEHSNKLTDHEKQCAIALGKRVTQTASKLSS